MDKSIKMLLIAALILCSATKNIFCALADEQDFRVWVTLPTGERVDLRKPNLGSVQHEIFMRTTIEPEFQEFVFAGDVLPLDEVDNPEYVNGLSVRRSK